MGYSTKVADTLFRIGSHSSAKDKYLEVASNILGPTSSFPNLSPDGVISTNYGSLSDDKIADVMACCNGLAQCEKQLGNLEQVCLNQRFFVSLLIQNSGPSMV